MSDVVISPNMNLPVPIVGVDPGPDWATNINACLGILDQHNHSSGQGVQITPSGLNINSDLTMNSNNLTYVNTVRFVNLSGTLAGTSPNLGCIYEANNELIYNDGAGNVVPITKTGSVNAGAGSITGLPSGTASASYSAGSQTFIWQSATNTPANMDFGSGIFRNIVANSKGLTLNPPNAMGADYSVALPQPNGTGNTVVLTYDTSNNIGLGPSLSQLFQIFASTQVTTSSTGITSTSFVTFSNSPALTFTPTVSGTYKVYCCIPIQTSNGSSQAVCRIFNTSGGATLLQESQATCNSAAGIIHSSILVQSNYTLVAGSPYVFDIQGKDIGAVGIDNRGDIAPFYMFAEL